jgi:hypothetical protein
MDIQTQIELSSVTVRADAAVPACLIPENIYVRAV